MPDKKLTDKEVVKALEICGTYKGKCTDCPAFVKVDRSNCKNVLLGAVEIINRLQAENERLKPFEDKIAEFKSHIRVENMLVFASSLEEWLEFCDNLKAEAYKEFVDLLKAKADELQQVLLDGKWAISQYDIDKLLKEKVS